MLKIDPLGLGSPMFKIETLVSLAACNHCGDYYVNIRRIGEKIVAMVVQLRVKKKPESIARIKEILSSLTKSYSRAVCDYYRQQRVWDSDFVDQLVESPDKTVLILKLYRKGVAAQSARQPHLPTTTTTSPYSD